MPNRPEDHVVSAERRALSGDVPKKAESVTVKSANVRDAIAYLFYLIGSL